MRAEVLKNGEWQKLVWRRGDAPIIKQRLESNKPFAFIADSVRVRIYDQRGLFRPGGALEIVRGDEVRFFGGSSDSIRLFQGVVDRSRDWDAANNLLTFDVIGFASLLNDLRLGRWTDGVIGGSYRYIKYQDDPVEQLDGGVTMVPYEYVAWPRTYEIAWSEQYGKRSGFVKRYIFDTFVDGRGVPFSSAAEDGLLNRGLMEFVGVPRDEIVFRIPRASSYLSPASVAQIFADIARQAGMTGVIDIAPISRALQARLSDKTYILTDWIIDPDNSARLYAIAFASDPHPPEGRGDDGRAVEVVQIENSVDWRIRATLALSNRNDIDGALIASRSDGRTGGYNRRRGNVEFPLTLSYQSEPFGDGKVLIAKIWGWSVSAEYLDNQGRQTDYRYQRSAFIDVYVYDYNLGSVVFERRGAIQDLPTVSRPNQYRRVSVDGDVVTPQTPAPLRRESIQIGLNRWLSMDGVPFFVGAQPLDRAAIRAEEATAGSILRQLAVLTNSIVSVDNDRTLRLVRRSFYRTDVHASPVSIGNAAYPMVSAPKLMISSNYGAAAPKISVDWISNEDFNRALTRFYEDEYFPLEEEVWTLTLLETDLTANLNLLDAVRFSEIGFDGEPAIIRERTVQNGVITIIATRSTAARLAEES